MPDVGSNQFRAANSAGNFVQGIPYGKNGTTGGPNNDGWKYGIAVYAHNGTTWVEIWNARPEVVSTSMATTGSGLTFSGTADPNNFSTTAKFEYKEVGAGSYSDSGTTTTGMGDGIDGAVSYAVTATIADTYKNWEARASATNTGGTGTGSTVTLDCRKHDAGGSGWGTTNSSPIVDPGGNCDSCGTRSRIDVTYTKSGCQQYVITGSYGACSDSWTAVDPLVIGYQCVYATGVGTGVTGYYNQNALGPGYIRYTTGSCENLVGGGCGGNTVKGTLDLRYCSTSGLYRAYSDDCVSVSI